MVEILSYIALVLLLCLSFFLFGYYVGKIKGQKYVVAIFDNILIRIYKLVVSGEDAELRSFMSAVCGKHLGDKVDTKMGRDDSG